MSINTDDSINSENNNINPLLVATQNEPSKNQASVHKNTNHIEYIDVLRVISMFFVVFLHTVAGSLRGNIDSIAWHISNVLTAVMSSAVPIFFMISGANLLSSRKTTSLEVTYKNRLPRVVIPFLVWSIVAIFYYILLKYIDTDVIDWSILINKLKTIISQPTTLHLWFMYALIPLYILSPILKYLVDAIPKDIAKYVAFLFIIFGVLLPTIVSFLPKDLQPFVTLNVDYNLNFMNGYVGYFLIGYYLFIYKGNISKILLTGIITLDIFIISLGTWYITLQKGAYDEIFKTYSRFFMVVLSISIFVLVKELLKTKRLKPVLSKTIQVLSTYSFGVYLIHNLLVDLASNIINLWPARSIYVIMLSYGIILVASLLSVFILASTRITCYIFTGIEYNLASQIMNVRYLFKNMMKTK